MSHDPTPQPPGEPGRPDPAQPIPIPPTPAPPIRPGEPPNPPNPPSPMPPDPTRPQPVPPSPAPHPPDPTEPAPEPPTPPSPSEIPPPPGGEEPPTAIVPPAFQRSYQPGTPQGVPGFPDRPPRKLSTGVIVAAIAAAIVIVLCLVCGVIGLIRANDDRASGGFAVVPTPGVPTAPMTPAAAPTPKSLAPETLQGPVTTFAGEGAYLVGADIVAGQYRARVPETSILCYWERLSGTSGEFADIIANGEAQPGAPEIVTIAHSDAAFRSRGCGVWSLVG